MPTSGRVRGWRHDWRTEDAFLVNLLRLRCAGLSNAAIAERLGVSRQRIAQRLTPRIAIRRIVIERVRGQCEHCGLHVGRSGWIYHKTSRVVTCDEYNDLNNLAVLCPPCHRRARRMGSDEVPPRSPIVVPSKTATVRLGEQILRRRQEQHLTRKQLAARAHTSHANLAKIERGGRLASRAFLARIARVLRCSATDFVVDGAARGGRRRADGIKSGAGFRHEPGRLNVMHRSL